MLSKLSDYVERLGLWTPWEIQTPVSPYEERYGMSHLQSERYTKMQREITDELKTASTAYNRYKTWYDGQEEYQICKHGLPSEPLAVDRQVGGGHYKDMAIQPIEYIMANDLGFCEGNIIKYICRYATKGGEEDIDKVIHYAQLLKESKYGQGTQDD